MIKLLKEWRYVSAGVAISSVLFVGFFLVQSSRESWPFAADAPSTIDKAAAPSAPQAAKDEHAAHARAPVDFEPSRLEGVGVRVEPAKLETISSSVRAMATVVPDESRVSHVHTRVAGWIERLYIDTTGQSVRAGQPLAGIFSQELLSSQSEYLSALRSAASNPKSVVLEGARARLKVFGMSDAQIEAIEKRGEPDRLVTVVAPRAGVVLHRGVSVGAAVDPSTEIVTVADLSKVWVFAEVAEADVHQIAIGTRALLEFPSSGRPPFEAEVDFLYPTLTERTRTLRVRFGADNPSGSLRPGIYGTADFRVTPREALTVGRDAIVDTGVEQHVFVVAGPGKFVPRTVKLGVRLENRIEIRSGLEAEELVVASGVFLIDSESRLRASGGGTGHAGHGGAAKPKASADDSPPGPNAAGEPAPPPAQGHAGH